MAVVVGLFIGAVGVGGVLLIPFLAIFGGLGIHTAAATALFTFLFTGLFGTWLFARRGSIHWRLTLPVCVGAVLFGYLGSVVAARIPANALAITIASIIVAAGVYVFVPPRGGRRAPRDGASRGDIAMLVIIGAAAGFGSGLSGAGGPLFSVGASQVLQIIASVSGSLAAIQDARIDFALAAWVTGFELVGVAAGVRLAHAVSPNALRHVAGALCVTVGIFMLVRAL